MVCENITFERSGRKSGFPRLGSAEDRPAFLFSFVFRRQGDGLNYRPADRGPLIFRWRADGGGPRPHAEAFAAPRWAWAGDASMPGGADAEPDPAAEACGGC